MRNEPLRPVPKPGTDKQKQGRTNKRHGTEAERLVAKKLGGRRVYGSGSTPFEKGDVRVEDVGPLFVEVKYVGESYGLKREWLEKTILDAGAVGCLPVVAVRFPGGDGVYVTTASVFETLVAQIRELKRQVELLEQTYMSPQAVQFMTQMEKNPAIVEVMSDLAKR